MLRYSFALFVSAAALSLGGCSQCSGPKPPAPTTAAPTGVPVPTPASAR